LEEARKISVGSRKAAIFDVRGWKARPLLRICYGMFDGEIMTGRIRRALAREKLEG